MIYTLTLNPSLDYIVALKNFEYGSVNQTEQAHMFPGGKGINVSRVLHRLGHTSIAIGCVGGFTGDYIGTVLQQEGIKTDFVTVNGNTRINVKVRADIESEINGVSPSITTDNLGELKRKLQQIGEDDIFVAAGSLPNSLSSSLYRELIELLPAKTKVIVDTKGIPLLKSIEARPFLIKPNHHELGELFNVVIETTAQAEKYASELLREGAQHVLVSMADKGALLVTKQGSYYCNVPKGKVVNSVGAGDSLVAGFLAGYLHNNKSTQDAFQYGVAAGSASAFSIGFCTEVEVNRLVPTIQIQKIK